MKKIFCALFGVFVFVSAFAGVDGDGGTYKNVSSEMWISRYYIENLKKSAGSGGNLADDVVDAMLAKYDELAASEDIVMKTSVGNQYFTVLDGTEPLTLQDLNAICIAGGFTEKEACRTNVINPIYTNINRVSYHNVCKGEITGGTNHCVDDVFVKEYEYDEITKGEWHNARQEVADGKDPHINFHNSGLVINGDNYRYDQIETKTVTSKNPYAQDVEVSEWTAYGFALEYARLHGHRVVCSSNVEFNWINCTSVDNQHFYTFRFKDTYGGSDTSITDGFREKNVKNIARGICALFGINAYEGFHIVCEKQCDNEIQDVSKKFAMNAHSGEYYTGFANTHYGCAIDSIGDVYNDVKLKTYPRYEHMSTAFSKVQARLEPTLINVLKLYIKSQGIEIKSFTCAYNTINSKADYVLPCKLNGTDVDFLFDDLYETAEYAKKAGFAGMSCLTASATLGKVSNKKFTTKFDGKSCIGPDKEICDAMNNIVPGGTEWDADSDRCVLKAAEKAANINFVTTLIIDGVALAVTVVSGAGLVVIIVTAVSSVGVTLGSKWLEDFESTLPNEFAKEFVKKASACNIPEKIEYDKCSAIQKKCAKDALIEFDKSLGYIIDGTSTQTGEYIGQAAETLLQCVTEADLEDIEIKSTTRPEMDFVEASSAVLMVMGFASPSGSTKFTMFTKFHRLTKWLNKISYTSKLKKFKLGENLYRIKLTGKIPTEKLNSYIEKMKKNGFSVMLETDAKTGQQFFRVFETELDINSLKLKASQSFDNYLDEFLKTGRSNGLPVSRLTKEQWGQLSKHLEGQGVELYEDVMNGNRVMRFRKISSLDINSLKLKASQNFDRYLAEAMSSNPTFYMLPAGRLTESEWMQLNAFLKNQGVELVDSTRNGEKYKIFKLLGSKGEENWIFSKIYNDMPDEILNAKLKYIYEHSNGDIVSAVNALKASGIYDAQKVSELAQDLGKEAVIRIRNSGSNIIDRMKRYKYMTNEEKKVLAGDLHEIITTERRNHVGNTIVNYDFESSWSWQAGSGTSSNGFRFVYGLKGDSIEGLVSIVFHENTHALQKLGKSALPKPVADWNARYYADPNNFPKLYYDNVIEIESYQIGNEAAKYVIRALGV